MNKFIILFMCCILPHFLTACGSTDSVSENIQSESTENLENTPGTNTDNSDMTAQNAKTTENYIPEQSGQAFSNIEVECKTGTITIRSENTFSLTYENGKTAEYSITDNTLYIPIQDTGALILALPDDYLYDTVTLSVEKGHIYSNYSFDIKQFDLELDDGEAKLEQIQVSENSSIRINRGSAFLNGIFAGATDAQCREGHLQIQTSARQSDFNYSMKTVAGNLQVGEYDYHGAADKVIDNGAENTMDLSCTFGDISVVFEE